MKKISIVLLLGSIFFAGCATQHYIVLLSNGQRVVAAQKPHLEGFNFVFTDLSGRTNSISSEYVRAVAPDTGKSTGSPAK